MAGLAENLEKSKVVDVGCYENGWMGKADACSTTVEITLLMTRLRACQQAVFESSSRQGMPC